MYADYIIIKKKVQYTNFDLSNYRHIIVNNVYVHMASGIHTHFVISISQVDVVLHNKIASMNLILIYCGNIIYDIYKITIEQLV